MAIDDESKAQIKGRQIQFAAEVQAKKHVVYCRPDGELLYKPYT